ncbi:chemotaxis protein CheW [Niallia sp. Krafla_26]|uniref:chemotaxis protein CheW n=1 Tax=Niallia sp. Krafla_26 TaxID=3064703 RepID=UPI003D170752
METNQYLEVFLDESREHLQAVNDNILKLEKEPTNIEIINEIFRSAHTLKGMSATMGFDDIAALTHKMENVFDQIRNNKINVSSKVIDIIFLAIEYLEEMVQSISEGKDGKKDVTELVKRLEQLVQVEIVPSASKQQDSKVEESVMGLDLDEYQRTIIKHGIRQGFFAYQVTVELREDCMLKGVRAYMVFEQMENHAEIIKTVPATEKIEEGDFEQTFSLLLLTKEMNEDIKKLISNVSEIKQIRVNSINLENVSEKEEETFDKSKEKKESIEGSPIQADSSKNNSSMEHGTSSGSHTIRVNLEKIDELMNLFEEVVVDRGRLETISESLRSSALKETVDHMSRISTQLQTLILTLRMVPIEQVFNRFPRMIRGLSRDLHKKINLTIEGAETELDRTVIDEIGDPLVHMIRNSVDHGIELPEVRKQSGKTEEGHLTLRAFHSGNHVFIEIEDDGAGIDQEKVAAKAIDKGLISAEQVKTLSDEEANKLIFLSGFSTADKVSNISGRGVGLDVVKNKIEALGGQIDIQSTKGKGSIFTIQLPLTLSIITSLLVRVLEATYAIPLSSIVETLLLDKEQIFYVNSQKVYDYRGHIIPLVSLSEYFHYQVGEKQGIQQEFYVAIIKKGDQFVGLMVDDLVGQKEIVLKTLGVYLGDVSGFSGATILGDGSVALVLDPNVFFK